MQVLPANLGQWETVEQIGIDSYHFTDALGDLKSYGLRVQLCYHRVGANFVDLHKISPEMFRKRAGCMIFHEIHKMCFGHIDLAQEFLNTTP